MNGLNHLKRYLALLFLLLLVACPSPIVPETKTLTVTKTGSGSGTVSSSPSGIDCGASCQANFQRGTSVTLTALPAATSSFAGWSGCDSQSGTNCTVMISSDRAISLTFTASDSQDPSTGGISGTLVFPGNIGGPSAELDLGVVHDLGGVGRDVEVVPGEVVVKFKDTLLQSQSTLQVAGIPLALVRTVGLNSLSLYRAEGLSQAETMTLVAILRARADVEDAFPNWILHAFKTPNDELYPFQWHYEAFNLPNAWDIEDGSSNPVIVAIVDTGIIPHPDLVPNLLPGFDFVDRDTDPTDGGGKTGYHGAHVAGTVAAASNNSLGVAGVSWGAKIVPVRVLGATGSGSFVNIIDGIIWAAGNPENEPGLPANPNPAKVVNLSLGGNIGEPCPQALNFTFGQLVKSGAILVAAAGNDNINAANSFPANCSNVITVGATGPSNTRAPYSNFGSVIDVMAPGGDTSRTLEIQGKTVVAGVLSTLRDDNSGQFTYSFFQGTSMAAPHVSGLVALMLAREPGLSFAQVKARLQAAATALDASSCGRPTGSDCGAGFINAALALGSDVATPPPPPPPPPSTEVPTYVVAFFCVPLGGDACADFDLSRSAELLVPTTSNEVPYRISGLEPATYKMAAWQDLNQDLKVDKSEPFGVNPNLILVQAGQTQTGVTISLEPFSPLAADFDPLMLTQLREAMEGLSLP